MPKPLPPFLVELGARLRSLPGYRARPMFGGYGLYLGDQIFAVADDGKVYFHIDDETQPAFEAEDCGPFEYAPGQFLRSYFELPPRVLRDDVLLVEWAVRAATRPAKATRKKAGKDKFRRKA